ncbi:MAG TPA: L-threonylcarbamoyladenylate synthase [Vulgatibacter sp.]|nr:L-threonylcarbamoyladenylate synthase [Vulgatibacter sp.]
MKTEILEVVAGPKGERAIQRAAQLLRDGRLVAFPTETVYGLGALALDPIAVARIFEAKGRPTHNPLIVHVADRRLAREVVASWGERADALADAFWPGPLTLVLPKSTRVPAAITAGLDAVAVRIPSHPVARDLLAAVGAPVAAPSANRYTRISPTTARHVEKSLGGRIDAILDGGATPIGIESTVLDLCAEVPRLLRPGAISADELREVVGRVDLATAAPAEGAARPSPGLSPRHYAPAGRVELVAGGDIEGRLGGGERVGVIARRRRPGGAGVAAWLELPADAGGFARQLYAALHALEDAGVERIVVEAAPDGTAWDGVRDRLRRAATPAGA